MKIYSRLFFYCFFALLLLISGCGIMNIDKDTQFFDDFNDSTEARDQFYNEVLNKITDENQKIMFEADFFLVSAAELAAVIYYSSINLYILTPKLAGNNIQKSGDAYTITNEGSVVKLRFDKATRSSQIEIFEGGVITSVMERVKLSDTKYAYQLYEAGAETKYVIQFLLDGNNGWISVDEAATSAPASIYKAKNVGQNFGKVGTRTHSYELGSYTYVGDIDIPTKTVIDISILAGLKAAYDKNEAFSVTDITLKVEYDDSTTSFVSVTAAMVVGSLPTTSAVGTKTLTLKYGGFQKSFSFEVVDGSEPTKTVTDFTVFGGLKTSYQVNEQFIVTDLVLEVTYSDLSNGKISATADMIVGTWPSTETIGEKTFTLKVGEIQKDFSFHVIEATLSHQDKLQASFNAFYQTLYMSLDENGSLISNNSQRIYEKGDQKILDFFNYEFTDKISDQWSNLLLLNEAIMAIKADEEDLLGTVYFENPTPNFGKTAYCTYNSDTKTYNVGYWTKKQINTMFWFECEIAYDEVADSLKALIKCGVDSEQLIRGHVEYTKISEGNYACMLYYPEDENNDLGKYDSFQFRFNNRTGVISQNLWVEARPESIYQSTNLSAYGNTGDKTLTITETEITFIDNLNCEAEDFLNGFMRYKNPETNELEYEQSLEYNILTKMETLGENDGFYGEPYSLLSSELDDNIMLLANYEKKIFSFDDYDSVKVTINGDTTTFVIDCDYTITTYIFKYEPNRLSLTINSEDGTSLYELVRIDSTYFVQMVYDYGESYYITQCKYVDINNAVVCYFESENMPYSIYSTILKTFTTTYIEKYTLTNNVFSYAENFPDEE